MSRGLISGTRFVSSHGIRAQKSRSRQSLPTFRRSLMRLRQSYGEGQPMEVRVAKDHLLGFVEKLQTRYPFTFAVAYRDLNSERNKQAQERLATHFLLGALSELSGLESGLRERVWALGGLLSRQIGKGGEHFRPRQFLPAERVLAQEIGEKNLELLIQKAEELSLALRFKMGPVNPAEHVICWCFRYVRQLLKAAQWESGKGAVLPVDRHQQ